MVVKWLRLGTFIAKGFSLVPGWGTKMPQAAYSVLKNLKKKKKLQKILISL